MAEHTKNADGTTVITEHPSEDAYTNDVVEEALKELRPTASTPRATRSSRLR